MLVQLDVRMASLWNGSVQIASPLGMANSEDIDFRLTAEMSSPI